MGPAMPAGNGRIRVRHESQLHALEHGKDAQMVLAHAPQPDEAYTYRFIVHLAYSAMRFPILSILPAGRAGFPITRV